MTPAAPTPHLDEVRRRFLRGEAVRLKAEQPVRVPGDITAVEGGGYVIIMLDGGGEPIERITLNLNEEIVSREPRHKPRPSPEVLLKASADLRAAERRVEDGEHRCRVLRSKLHKAKEKAEQIQGLVFSEEDAIAKARDEVMGVLRTLKQLGEVPLTKAETLTETRLLALIGYAQKMGR